MGIRRLILALMQASGVSLGNPLTLRASLSSTEKSGAKLTRARKTQPLHFQKSCDSVNRDKTPIHGVPGIVLELNSSQV